MSLSEEDHRKIKGLCSFGDRLAKSKRYGDAKEKYLEALKVIPNPRENYEAATWVYVAIGDMNFHSHQYEQMKKSFSSAAECPDGLGNPYIHLRLGQCSFELGNLELAVEELTRAYMGGGAEIFEEDDPKYLQSSVAI